MKKIISLYNNTNLIIRIAIGMLLGTLLAFVFPHYSAISIFGTLFIGALKGIAPLLVFVLITSSIANAKTNDGSSKFFKTVVSLYILSTALSAIIAVGMSFLFPVTLNLSGIVQNTAAPNSIAEVLFTLINNVVTNPIKSITDANYLGILTWAIIFGFAFKHIAGETTKKALVDFSNAISEVVKWIINFAPFGILGIVFKTVAENGLFVFSSYAKLLILLIGSMLIVMFFVGPIISMLLLHKNPYPLLLCCLKESGLTAFFTRSSAANIPVNLALCEKLGIDKNFYSVSIPLGATINMNGAAVTITIMTLAATHTLGIPIDIPTAVVLSILVTIAACGASGVAGGSLLLIPMACSLFGISNDVAMQVVGVGFIIGIIQDSMETAVNSSSDVFFAATAARFVNNQKLK